MSTILGPHREPRNESAGAAPRRSRLRAAAVSLLLLPLASGLAGCISSSNPPPPANNTIIVPSGSTAICADGTQPPCR
jgi:hypothetical protein